MRAGVFVSLFPTTATTYTGAPLDGPMFPQLEGVSDADAVHQLRSFVDSLRRKDFGLTDVFWFLSQALQQDTTGQAIIGWMRSLYIASYAMEKGLGVITIKSEADATFEKKAYAHDESLPQEALDTPAVLVGDDGKIMMVLGKKAKAPVTAINFPEGPISLLKVGLYGSVIVGEHIEPAEKAGLFAALDRFKQSGAPFLELAQKAAGAAVRALAEESGIQLGDGAARYFMIGEDTQDGRDPRYWKCGSLYGYPRKSRSVMIVVVLTCQMPAEMPDPIDRVECEKASLFPLDFVLHAFHRDGKLKPAFDAHVRQLSAVAKVLPAIVDSM
jgi:hypothetical protein